MRLVTFVPLAILGIVLGFSLWALTSDRDPNAIPSALVGRALPPTDLPPVAGSGSPGLASADMGEGIVMVNVFASWCVPCRAEHPILKELVAETGLPLMGLNYKDEAADAAAFLDELGNPYTRIGFDLSGRAGIDWGVTGVPETFILEDGIVAYRHTGPIIGEAEAIFREALEEVRG